MSKSKNLFLYDPRTNVLTLTDYTLLSEMTGQPKNALQSSKFHRRKIKAIGCYLVDDSITLQERRKWYAAEVFEAEAWKELRGSNGKYLISSYGRFKRLCANGKENFILPYYHKKKGSLRIKVRFDHVYGQQNVAPLVGIHFVGGAAQGKVLRFKNGIRTDCYAGNLEYIDKKKLAQKTGPMSRSKPVVQLDPETKEIIGEFRSAREAGRKCFLSYQAVLDNCNGKSRTSGGYIFKFEADLEMAQLG